MNASKTNHHNNNNDNADVEDSSSSASSSSSADTSSSYRRQTILNLYKSGITTDIISSQTGISQENVNKIIQDANQEEVRKDEYLKEISYSPLLQQQQQQQPFAPNAPVDLNSIIRRSQTRVWKTLEGEPEFVISAVETQDILGKYAKSKLTLVILNVDLVASTDMSMTLPLDRLTMIIQAFNQEMSIIVKAYGGYVLKYVGDAVLAFFVVPAHRSEAKLACINAINCAKCMVQVARQAINPILNQYDYPEMNVRIGIDIGENAIIQSGWDIHPNITNGDKNNKNIINNNNNKKEQFIKKPIYDVLSYTMSIAVKMTALANPNHIVIGQLVFDVLDDNQKSVFQPLDISPEIWGYVSNKTGGNIYHVYTNV
jgi:adenylate cyclase